MRKSWGKPTVYNLSSQSIQTGQVCTTMQPEGEPSLGIPVASTMCVAAATPNGVIYVCGQLYVLSASTNCAFSANYANISMCGNCPFS